MYDIILYDLDGTLTDSAPGIMNSIRYALERFGIHDPDEAVLRTFIGPPLMDSFRREFGFGEEQGREAIKYYREYFAEKGMLENAPYPGIPGMLERLRGMGAVQIVATSKPEVYSVRILEHFGMAGYFSRICGATLDGSLVRKPDIIRNALDGMDLTGRRVVMVGDREHDILGARENGIPAIGALFGYGSRDELEKAGASALAAGVPELERLLAES